MNNKHKPAIAAIALACGAAAPAFAQSTVTLYGVADVYMQFAKGDKSENTLQSGGLSGSRWGLKGAEDLGSGLKAVFQLESGFAIDSGISTQGGLFFGRQAFVGLSSDSAGIVTFGRQNTPHFIALDAADPFATGAGSAASSGIVSVPASRANNSIAYSSPKFGPVAVSLMGAAGEKVTGAFTSADVHYAANKLDLGVSYARKNRFGTQAEAATYALFTAGYDFGSLKVTGGVQAAKNTTQAAATQDDRTEFFGGVLVPVGQGTISAGAGAGKTKNVNGTRASQVSLGYTHSLSKRTDLYAVGTGINNGASTSFTADTATGSGPAASANKDVRAVVFGIRHRF